MSPQEMDWLKWLHRMVNACEFGRRCDWYLLVKEGTSWHPVGGPYHTRAEARDARREAIVRWQALPWDTRIEYYRATGQLTIQ